MQIFFLTVFDYGNKTKKGNKHFLLGFSNFNESNKNFSFLFRGF